jgi:hypothetical protein
MIARVAEPALVVLGKRRVGLEIGAGQIVQQHVEGDVEQVPPAPYQVIEQSLLVLQQPVVAAVERVAVRQRRVGSQQIRQGAAPIPFAVQAPLRSWCNQPVRDQHQQHMVPACALAARRQPVGPEAIKPQLLPQLHGQPARAPLPGPTQPHLRQLQPYDRGVRQHPVATIFRKQRQGSRSVGALFQDLNRLAPRQFLRGVDLAQIQHVPLQHASAAHALVLDKAPVAVLLAVLLANRGAQKHDGNRLCRESPH